MAGTSSTELSPAAASAAALLAAAADPVRWTVLDRLAETPRCVCDLQEHVPVAANLLSYHLKVLRDAGLVVVRAEGTRRLYRLRPEGLREVEAWLEPYRVLWAGRLDDLERHLDRMAATEPSRRTARRGRGGP